jgi:CRISPR-associated endoribonuclease Cas6
MPSLWRLPLPDGGVDRRQVHRRLASWLDVDHHASRKPWSWKATDSGIEIGLLDDGLADRLAQRAGRDLTRLSAVPWHVPTLSKSPEWTVEFVSPVAFRRGNRLVPWPSPSAVFGSLRADWRAFAAPHAGDVDLDLSVDPVIVTAIEGASVVERFVLHDRPNVAGGVPVRVTVGGFRGRVTYAVDGPLGATAVASLLAIAPYAGVGAHTTRGFGGVRLCPG